MTAIRLNAFKIIFLIVKACNLYLFICVIKFIDRNHLRRVFYQRKNIKYNYIIFKAGGVDNTIDNKSKHSEPLAEYRFLTNKN